MLYPLSYGGGQPGKPSSAAVPALPGLRLLSSDRSDRYRGRPDTAQLTVTQENPETATLLTGSARTCCMKASDRYAGRPALPSTSVGQIDADRPEIREVGTAAQPAASRPPVTGAVHRHR